MRLSLSSLAILTIISISSVIYFVNDPLNTEINSHTISWDVAGYYAYLPSYLLFNDPGLERDFDGVKLAYYSGPQGKPGKPVVNKYTMGIAYQYLPYFLISHYIISNYTDYYPNSLSPPYHRAMLYAGYINFFIGLLFFRKLLLTRFDQKVTSIILLLLFIGTNLMTNVVWKAALPHNWLFTQSTFLLYLAYLFSKKHRWYHLWLFGLCAGILTLSRITDFAIVIAIGSVLLYRNSEWLMRREFWWKGILPATIIFFLVFVPQMLHWHHLTGHYIYDSYSTEGFYWTDSKVWWGLFSSYKGWFIYSPIMLFILPGFVLMAKKYKIEFHLLFWPFVVSIYIMFAWWCWWYGGSYGNRTTIEWMPLLAFPFGLFIEWVLEKKWLKNLAIAFSIIACFHSAFMSHHFMRKSYHSDSLTFEGMGLLYRYNKRTPEFQKSEIIVPTRATLPEMENHE